MGPRQVDTVHTVKTICWGKERKMYADPLDHCSQSYQNLTVLPSSTTSIVNWLFLFSSIPSCRGFSNRYTYLSFGRSIFFPVICRIFSSYTVRFSIAYGIPAFAPSHSAGGTYLSTIFSKTIFRFSGASTASPKKTTLFPFIFQAQG